MRIGKLNKRAAFQSEARTTDNMGGYTRTWSTDFTVWCFLKPKAGRELLNAGQQTHFVGNDLVIRYREDVTTEMRVVIEGVNYNIQSFSDMNSDRKYLTLSITQGVAI